MPQIRRWRAFVVFVESESLLYVYWGVLLVCEGNKLGRSCPDFALKSAVDVQRTLDQSRFVNGAASRALNILAKRRHKSENESCRLGGNWARQLPQSCLAF